MIINTLKEYWKYYWMRGYFHGGFIFANFASQSSQKLQYMAIYSNENITKIVKLSHREFSHPIQSHKNICMRNIWRIQYFVGCPAEGP